MKEFVTNTEKEILQSITLHCITTLDYNKF
jgi:hypothetical protein